MDNNPQETSPQPSSINSPIISTQLNQTSEQVPVIKKKRNSSWLILIIAGILVIAPFLGFNRLIMAIMTSLLGNPSINTPSYAAVNITTLAIWALMDLSGIILAIVGIVKSLKRD